MKKVLITGGAGFIGSNLAAALSADPSVRVVVYDNLSRKGSERNRRWLRSLGRPNLATVTADVRDRARLGRAMAGCSGVYHLAAQVAVTTSVADPVGDFEINAAGTLYALEACRAVCPDAFFVYSSTNKVYGELAGLKLRETATRYRPAGAGARGVSEDETLDFHSPYGVSKGSADQYVRDYRRIYGLKTVVFRQSCIYGPRQFGNEDQGWVAHFVIRALLGGGLTVYGDGKQIRDVLDVSDLVRAYRAAAARIETAAGEIYNIGGGPENTVSLLELIAFLRKELKAEIPVSFEGWRPGDQKVYISDNRKLARDLGWRPRVGTDEGVRGLIAWARKHLREIAAANRGA